MPSTQPSASALSNFKWPELPRLPNSMFIGTEGHLYTKHQMQGYANAYGEVVRAVITALPAPVSEPITFEQLSRALHYPSHWDTAAYPDVMSALREVITAFECECATPPQAVVAPVSEPIAETYMAPETTRYDKHGVGHKYRAMVRVRLLDNNAKPDLKLYAAPPQAVVAQHHLSNLLARIHRDGGHYEVQHGTDKAVADADLIVARLNMEKDQAVVAQPVDAPRKYICFDKNMEQRVFNVRETALRHAVSGVDEYVLVTSQPNPENKND